MKMRGGDPPARERSHYVLVGRHDCYPEAKRSRNALTAKGQLAERAAAYPPRPSRRPSGPWRGWERIEVSPLPGRNG